MKNVLNELESNNISVKRAYKLIFKEKKIKRLRRSYFVKLNIKIINRRYLSFFIAILTFLPIYTGIANFILKRLLKEDYIKLKFYRKRNILLEVSNKVRIKIKPL